jgi:ubiquinone/menaquinone biosynthesis C-methylase UbiE
MNHNQKAVEIFNKLADAYAEKFMDIEPYRNALDFFCNCLQHGKKSILDLACGPGNLSRYLLHKRPDFQLLGTDLAENMVLIARRNNPEASFEVMDSKNLSWLKQSFDGIVCSFLLPYLSLTETEELFKVIYKKLEPQGVLYLGAIEGDYASSGFKKGSSGDEIFMHYYDEATLLEKLHVAGFEILKTEHIFYPMADGSKEKDILMVARKIKG